MEDPDQCRQQHHVAKRPAAQRQRPLKVLRRQRCRLGARLRVPRAPRGIPDDAVAEYFHFFQLRAELQQEEIDTRLFEFADLILDLRRRSDET